MAEGELRRVSILFADILNSTAMLQHLDPEEAAALLDPPLDAMRAAVDRYDGVVSHLGDGILAVFGAPSACEDHAVRACLAALSIQGAMAELAPVRARVGIHTGEVVMRERRIGRAQIWEPVGPALTVAARIEQSAEPGTISVSATTAEQARGFVEVTPLPDLAAKGFDRALPLLRLTGAEPGASRWTVRSANGLLPMVDRVDEQRTLRAALHAEEPRAVLIHGEPGIGKSRLLHEVLSTADPAWCHCVRLSGDPHRQDSAFHAFGLLLRGFLDIRAGDTREAALARLEDRTRRTRELTEAGRDSLARILGLLTPEEAGNSGAVVAPDAPAAVLALLRQASGGRRLVLACEDLDCFDAASRDLLTAVVEAGSGERLVVLATARTRVRLPGPGVAHAIHLQPLQPADTVQLLSLLDRRFTERPTIAAAFHAKTGGNPLFVEELGALATETLDREPGDGVPDTDTEDLPDRVEALIADRLSRLPRALKRLVQLCAVVGQTVPLRLLARLADTGETAVHKQLLRLQSAQILTETRRYPDPEFAFRHGLTREAAYRIILASRRRELHSRACDILEREEPGMSASRLDDLCFHAAGAQDWARAATHMRAASVQAAEKSAYGVARMRLDQALDASGRLPDTAERARSQLAMLLEKRVLLGAAGRYADVAGVLDKADQLARRLDDRPAQIRISVQRIHLLNIAGRMDEAVALGREACAAADALGDEALAVLAAHHLAQAHYNQGQVRLAASVLDDAVARLHRDGTGRSGSTGSLPVIVHATRALSLAFAGEDAAARNAADAAQAHAEQTGRPYDKAYSALAAGVARLRADPAASADLLLDGIALCDAGQIPQAAPALQAALGHLLLRSGDWAGAASWLARAYAACLEQTRAMVMCWAGAGLARALWELDDRETAAKLGAEAVDVARRGGYRGYLAVALRMHAALLPPAQAVGLLREAEALALALELNGEHAECRAALAELDA